MKITIQKREPDKNGHRALRLVYYHGSKTDQNGSRAQPARAAANIAVVKGANFFIMSSCFY